MIEGRLPTNVSAKESWTFRKKALAADICGRAPSLRLQLREGIFQVELLAPFG